MTKQTKPSFDEYKAKLIEEVAAESLFTSPSYYETYLNGITAQVKALNFDTLMTVLSDSASKYAEPDLLFLTSPSDTALLHKPLNSVMEKIYRNNVVYNRKWPETNGIAYSLANFHEKLDDLFRSRIICKYMDGPEFACKQLEAFCRENGIEYSYKDVTTGLGYHAWHFYFMQDLDDFRGQGATKISVEVQFTTQLAEVISSLTHVQYEASRLGAKPDTGWRWNVRSDHFRPYYLGHGLHLLEGVILEYRDSIIQKRHELSETDEDMENSDE